MAELVTCNACGGSGAQDESSQACSFCSGQGAIMVSGETPKDMPTERFNVTGQATTRVVVRWLNGVEHTLYRTEDK
jgi:DnaJ-class molecular chaperone